MREERERGGERGWQDLLVFAAGVTAGAVAVPLVR
jgi:hypothetical protein